MRTLDSMLAQIDSLEPDLIQLEQDLVRIPSINTGAMPTGNETQVCEYVQDWLRQSGIPSEILESAPNRGNIIASLMGKSGDTGLLFMSHTDVVPVEDDSKWSFPPFKAEIHEGRIYGRGASDCKGLLTAQLMAMRVLKENNVILKDNLSLISAADEEHGGRFGFGWLAENHPAKITAPFAINEGGGSPIEAARSLAYVLGTGEKGRLQIEFAVTGDSSHASVPWQGTNALYRLSRLLERIQSYEPELNISTDIFQHLSEFAIEHRPSSSNVDDIILNQEEQNPQLASLLKALSRMTITPTMVKGGVKSNSVPEQIQLTCDVRTLPNQDEAYLRTELDKITQDIPGISYDIDYMAVPNSSPFSSKLATHIQTATNRAMGRKDIDLIPAISTGFTDSRFTRPLGVTTYGFSGSHYSDDPMLAQAHGTDESIGIKSLISGTKVMLSVAYDLLVVA